MADPGTPERRSRSKIGLALAGGGPTGAIYEIGALRALDEVLEGVDFNDLHTYVGVSAGAFICANLANNLTPGQMCRAIVKHEAGEHPFNSEMFFKPAYGELLRRTSSVPQLALESLWRFVRNPWDSSIADSFLRMGRALPVGVLDNTPIREYLESIYTIKGRTDDFRKLEKRLIVVAADLDSGQAVRFGYDGPPEVPISLAVQASTALPGLYLPVEIDGRHFVDGVLLKTMHASVALETGVDLLFCLNPLVPVNTADAIEQGAMRRGKLIHRGLPSVLSQSLRTMIRSRMGAGLLNYTTDYPGAEIVLFEPPRNDYNMFFSNVFSFSSRRRICEHAYRAIRAQLRFRQKGLVPLLQRHGVTLRTDLLEDEDRGLWSGLGLGENDRCADALDDLDQALDRLEAKLGLGG